MKASVNKELCIGCSLCVQTCPEVFRMEGDVAVAYENPVPDEATETCRTAASDCPVVAIEIQE
ncbi:MAG TPA: ferredoxin [Candidatus Bathyarchaeia archaeon]|nr:ferredoxin [Candidatus Bathyarchaeia archaeon]